MDEKIIEALKELEVRIIKLELGYKNTYGESDEPDFKQILTTTKDL